VGGVPAADLGSDPESWRQAVLTDPAAGDVGLLSLAIAGDRAALGPLPGEPGAMHGVNQALVRALWPVLWGRAIKDIWNVDQEAMFAAGLWAGQNLFPEGPLPPIRIDDQPYGLLPATSLQRWVSAPADPWIEEQMRPSLIDASAIWASAAEAAGTIVGASTDQVLRILGQRPTSRGYAWRWFRPIEIDHLLSWGVGLNVPFEARVKWWEILAAQVLQFQDTPARRYATGGDAVDLAIPLVRPSIELYRDVPFRRLLAAIREAAGEASIDLLSPAGLFSAASGIGGERREIPDSLLLRLLVHAFVVGGAEIARLNLGEYGPFLEPLAVDTAVQPDPLLAQRMQDFAALGPNILAAYADQPQGQLYLAALEALEVMRGEEPTTLERAFRATLDAASHRIDPWPTGIAWRRLLDLQAQQAPAALGIYGWVDGPLLGQRGPTNRGLIHAPSDAQARAAILLRDRAVEDTSGRSDLEIDSRRARLAQQVGEEVRQGTHLYEALGRTVEREIGDPARIKALRRHFPLYKRFRNTPAAERRACDGYELLQVPATDPRLTGTLPVEELAALEPLREIVETYGDLLLADSAFHLLAGNAARAGAVMDAAAGLTEPPELHVLRTPRTGRAALSTVLTVLPAPAVPLDGPAALADAAVAGFLQAELDPIARPELWTWTVQLDVGTSTVTLGDLGLTVAESLALTLDELNRLAVEEANGAGLAAPPPAGRDRAERLARALGGQPAVPQDIATGAPLDDRAARDELMARLVQVHRAARTLSNHLRVGLGDELPRQLLHEASRWGIVPVSRAGETVQQRLRTVRAILDERIKAMPPLAHLATQPADRIAQAIGALASPGGRLPILSRLTRAQLGLLLPTDAGQLGTSWLEVVAAVRGRLGPLEAHQLGPTPFAAWTNRPTDPWQQTLTPAEASAVPTPATALTVAYGPPGVLTGGAPTDQVAVGLVDGWGETVPSTDHTSVAAFGFNAPSARAPQAILLAVTPDETRPLDGLILASIVLETRQLLRARMAGLDDLGALAAALPTIMLPDAPSSGVRLEP
jgi:hypothetical protein